MVTGYLVVAHSKGMVISVEIPPPLLQHPSKQCFRPSSHNIRAARLPSCSSLLLGAFPTAAFPAPSPFPAALSKTRNGRPCRTPEPDGFRPKNETEVAGTIVHVSRERGMDTV